MPQSATLPKRWDVTFEVKNLFNESFRFVDTDRICADYPDRFMLGRITLSF